ncbi:MAG: phage tail protein [Elusimicrobiota bacterium]
MPAERGWLAPADFKAGEVDEGGAIDLSWQNPAATDWVITKIYRSIGCYVTDPYDWRGKLVYEGKGTKYRDENLEPLRVYYYVAFGFDTDGNYGALCFSRDWALVVKDYKYEDWLYSHLPAIYRQYDTQDKVLKRFLRLPALKLNVIRSFIEAFPQMIDADTCPVDYLWAIAQLLGVDLEAVLTTQEQRAHVKTILDARSWKGTLRALEYRLRWFLKWNVYAREGFERVMITNRQDRRTGSLKYVDLLRKEDDRAGYVAATRGGYAAVDSVNVYIYVDPEDVLKETKKERVPVYEEDWLPVGVYPYNIFVEV